ncbi:MAG: PrsW family glutamic-type intramembrane protease [Candidatus Pacebacteria bacterium]|jgi:RsiW-degrading membrane proteinase PrsW (M82 family)|nr:PrsW family glutamic-type intramembrane protease [Candidatus Paceibacterota bacterium]
MVLTFILASLIGILPIALWLIFFLWQDIKKPEPLRWILVLFLLGIIITPFIWLAENYLLDLFQINVQKTLPFILSAFIYLMVAGIEELVKFCTAAFTLRSNKHFDEAIDAMIYLIVIALGFGAVENILVTYQEIVTHGNFLPTFQIMSLRFIGANLLHALSSGIIGFFWALKLVTGKKRYLGIGLILGILLHWVFNIAIINLGGDAVFLISLALFSTCIFILWAFDILKQIQKPIKINK